MFATCLHCHSSLGENQLLEQFPIGRRLAFDAAKGRLWVICATCRRWNLSPIEERWEIIEECERMYGATRLRASTDNIGLARLADGLEVVRIGAPKTPEMAAWRYAGDFRRRWIKKGIPLALLAGGVQGMNQAVINGGARLSIAAMAAVLGVVAVATVAGGRVALALPNGQVVRLSSRVQRHIRLRPARSGWSISLGEPADPTIIAGAQAIPAIRSVMTVRNSRGAPARDVNAAIALLAEAREPDRFIAKLAIASARTKIHAYPPDIALALEMALHESTERRAIEGELAQLREEWELAEEIAGIADNMFLPEEVRARLQQLQGAPHA